MEKEKLVITYNGEIYNYIELKEELKTLGYSFDSDCDTEVVLLAYQHWGVDCVKKFNGMWAFSIFDKENNIIFSSRDRFGIKPFYYYETDSSFYFSSEIKQFTVIPNFEKKLNTMVAIRFLVYSDLNTTNETFFNGVYELNPGNNLIYDLSTNTFNIQKWYDVNSIRTKSINEQEAQNKFKELFYDSVRLRLRSDVKLGCLLSGGLDSSSIVSVVDQLLRDKKFDTISSCFKEKEYDEQEYIDILIKEKNINAHKIFPNLNEFFSMEIFDLMVFNQDQPFSSASHFAEYCVFQSAKEQKLKVVLDGQGADETLAGYHDFFYVYLLELIKNLKFTTFLKEVQYIRKHHKYSFKRISSTLLIFALPKSIENKLRQIFGKSDLSKWIDFSKVDSKKMNYIKKENFNLLQYSKKQLSLNSVPYQLHSEDRNSMIHSIESRLPFLDYRLVEFILSLPSSFKIKDGTTKCILRESLKKILPLKIKQRQNKMGFVTPEEIWMRENKEIVLEQLHNAVEYTNGLINKEIINDFNNMILGNRSFSHHYFRVISFYRWLKVFEVKI